jgi:hypothetical protein
MQLPAALAPLVASWASFYDAHRAVSVTVRYLHLVGLVTGGGTALVADRQVLRALRAVSDERAAVVAGLRASHRVVVPALAVVVATGALMTASDIDTFFASRLYWAKLGLVALLLMNGLGLVAAERAFERGRAGGWRSLGFASAASLVLWLAILLAGVWLTAAA